MYYRLTFPQKGAVTPQSTQINGPGLFPCVSRVSACHDTILHEGFQSLESKSLLFWLQFGYNRSLQLGGFLKWINYSTISSSGLRLHICFCTFLAWWYQFNADWSAAILLLENTVYGFSLRRLVCCCIISRVDTSDGHFMMPGLFD